MEEPMDCDREATLGFIPQREIPYSKLLPYADKLDAESNHQLAEIKTHLGRAVQLRDIKTAASHWVGQLSKYIRLYGHKYSKSDHLCFIHLMFELTTIPELELTLVQRFAQLLCQLIKKRDLLTRDDLEIPWKPLYALVERTVYNSYEDLGLQLIPQNLEGVLKNLVRFSRVYFSVDATAEMLAEWRPLMCPFDMTMLKAMYYLELFLPTLLPIEQHHKGFKLWLDELLGVWDKCQITPSWEGNLVNLFARLAANNIGYIDWEPWIPKIFTRILRSLNLPVGSNKVQVTRVNNNSYDVFCASTWIVSILGGGTSCQRHINQFFKALHSFFHPSNTGKWSIKLTRWIFKLPQAMVFRIHRERHHQTWLPETPESHRITDDEITAFVDSMTPVVYLAMFGKFGTHESAVALDQLALMRPERVIPGLLEHVYPALETLTEPHRLIACLSCIVSVARSMVSSHQKFPEGRSNVLPILNLCLPGIDPNDIKKCLMTFQLISTFVSLVPLVDCSAAIQCRSDLTEHEIELCSASAQCEDFMLLFMDKLFMLIENSSQVHTRTDSQATEKLTHEESMIEVGMLSTFNVCMQQSSPAIYKEALKKLFRFVTSNVFEIRVAGRYAADLCRGAAKVNPGCALPMLVPHFCDIIIHRAETDDALPQEEQIDNEFLWNLKLLSEVVRCDSVHLMPYMARLRSVLSITLHLKCKEAAKMAGNLLRHLLKALTLTFALDYRSSSANPELSLQEHLPIRDWGKPGNLQQLDMRWHVPGEQQLEAARKLLETFLQDELRRVREHTAGTNTLTREDLLQSLTLIVHCLQGSGIVLPVWEDAPVSLIDSLVPMHKYAATHSNTSAAIDLAGENVRCLIMDTIQPLLKHMLVNSDDDTKSLNQVIKVYQSVLFFHGAHKEEFDGRWKSLHLVKRSMENKFIGKKCHIRAVLVDRVQLQHELRVINHIARKFTTRHLALFEDLLELSVSRYSSVRKVAQNSLSQGFRQFAYSYRSLLQKTLTYLRNDPSVEHHQFKGALYVVRGESRRSLMTKQTWSVIGQVWPAIVKSPHSEKPSIIKLVDDIMNQLHKNIEAAQIELKVPGRVIESSKTLWKADSPVPPSGGQSTEGEIEEGVKQEDVSNQNAAKDYIDLVNTLVQLIEDGNLHWRFHQMGLEMLCLIMRHDVRMPQAAVALFSKNLVSDTLAVRKLCTAGISAILKQQKRTHKKVEIDPYKISATTKPDANSRPVPGDRTDNVWHVYDPKNLPGSKEAWENTVFVHKTHWGYYTWPKTMSTYAPAAEQPALNRGLDDLDPEERPIFECFNDATFVEKLISFLSLEENKGRDKFHPKHFTLFKGLFRNFGDAFVPLLRPHIERLVADTGHDTHETSHRCAAELLAGIIRGSKHWTYNMVSELWSWLLPVFKTGLTNVTVESMSDWGTLHATLAESQDPRRLEPILDMLMKIQLNGDGGSFGDSSKLYMLQGSLAQQEWRVPHLLHQFLDLTKPHLAHPYKIVRDRIGSVLVNLFMYDLNLPGGAGTTSPRLPEFVSTLLPALEPLTNSLISQSKSSQTHQNGLVANGKPTGEEKMEVETSTDTSSKPAKDVLSDEIENDERATAIRVCKTMMKWVQGSLSRMLHCAPPELFSFLRVLCLLESETRDDELRQDAVYTLACMAQTLLEPEVVKLVVQTIKEICTLGMWHARAGVLAYLQVVVFCNLFNFLDPEIKADLRALVLGLLEDDQVEVREMAAVTLGGFLHCGYLDFDDDMKSHFLKLSRTKLPKRVKQGASVDIGKSTKLIQRHAGILGLSAGVQAFPYDVPNFMADVLMELSEHVEDPQPIQLTVKKCLSNFRRTHHDNWQDHKLQFTDDQLVILTDLLISPNYYA